MVVLCGLSHVKLLNSYCFKPMAFLFKKKLSQDLFIHLFNNNLASGGSLTDAILSCHVEL